MIKLSRDGIHSFIASLNHSDDKYIDKFWEKLIEDNPDFADLIAEHIRETMNEDEGRALFLEGVMMTYEIIRRQLESNEMNVYI